MSVSEYIVKVTDPISKLVYGVFNPAIICLLRSPLHGIFSKRVVLVTFTGRKSQRVLTTPVSYVRDGEAVRFFVRSEHVWWRNFRGGADVTLRTEGKDQTCHATVIEDLELKEKAFRHFFSILPADAAYHKVRIEKDRSLSEGDLKRALQTSIVIEAKPRAEPAPGC